MARTIADFHNHLGPVYVEVDQDVTRVHAYWKLVTQLFGSQESVAILNNAAGFAIRAIQDSLIDSVILRITKLTDPAKAQRGRFPKPVTRTPHRKASGRCRCQTPQTSAQATQYHPKSYR